MLYVKATYDDKSRPSVFQNDHVPPWAPDRHYRQLFSVKRAHADFRLRTADSLVQTCTYDSGLATYMFSPSQIAYVKPGLQIRPKIPPITISRPLQEFYLQPRRKVGWLALRSSGYTAASGLAAVWGRRLGAAPTDCAGVSWQGPAHFTERPWENTRAQFF
jgi:hypothetical protein